MSNSSYPVLRLVTVLFPPLLVGTAEYVRHEWWSGFLSMEAGNVLITLIVFVLSWRYAAWMFKRIETSNSRLAEEESRRAVYEERERLADELHDHIAQGLFFLNVKLQKGRTEEAKSAVADIQSHLRQAIFNLRTASEVRTDAEGRLRSWLEEWSGLSGIPCRCDLQMGDMELTAAEEVKLFGLIQEAFTNIRKHSAAEAAAIRLHGDRNGWSLSIEDNGIGFEAAGAAGSWNQQGDGRHYGLSMMSRRAAELGAELTIRPSGPRGGTLVSVECRGKEGTE